MEQKKGDEKGKRLHLHEYRKELLERVKNEEKKEDIINEFNIKRGKGLTSPTTSTTTEETRLLMEYIDRANMFNISKHNEKRGKYLKLRKFFKAKRNQQIEIYAKCGSESIHKVGKVSTVGRDFVMITNLKERMWIPYSIIESANIPFGIPNYSNTHQHFLYDNNLRNKLILQFGETVSKRNLLMQQFFEESLQTNLEAWKETWVVAHLKGDEKKIGKILSCKDNKLVLSFFGESSHINLIDLKYVETIRIMTMFSYLFKRFTKDSSLG